MVVIMMLVMVINHNDVGDGDNDGDVGHGDNDGDVAGNGHVGNDGYVCP